MNRYLELVIALLAKQLKGIDDETLRLLVRAHRAEAESRFEERLAQETHLSSQEAQLLLRLAQELIRACGGNTMLALTNLMPEDDLEALFGDLLPPELQPDLQTAVMPDDAFMGTPEEIMPLVDELEGRYTYISDQGKGGMGRVLLVHDTNTDREVALKELLPKSEHSGTSKESPVRGLTQVAARFLQEGRVTAQLEHPAIVPVYEIGKRRNDTLYYTMKLVRGETMLAAMRQARVLPERLKLLSHYVDLCQAIAYAHSKGVIHRDIKPNNVMIGEFGETVVLDWGVAHVMAESDIFETEVRQGARILSSGDDSWRATAYGRAIGTPHYMSPEQAEGDTAKMGPHSDVYSLGVVLYELLTGTVPFEGRNAETVIERVINERPKGVLEVAPDAPPELVSICEKAMAREPEHRYESAKALAEDIVRFQTGRYVSSYEYPLSEIAKRYYAKHKPLVHTVAGAAAALVIVLAGAYINVAAARDREAAQRKIAESQAYEAKIRLADFYRHDTNFDGMRETLLDTPPHLRHWEWGHLYAHAHQDFLTLRGHEANVQFAEYTPDGDRVITTAADKQLHIWDVASGDTLHEIALGEAYPIWTAQAPDGASVSVASLDGYVRVFNPQTAEQLFEIQAHTNAYCNHVAYSADGTQLTTAGGDGTVALWSAVDGSPLARWSAQDSDQKYVEFSPPGDYLLSWSENQRITLWERETGNALGTFEGFRARFSPDGTRFVHLLSDRAVVREVPTGRMLWETASLQGEAEQAFWSHNGAYLVTTSRKGDAQLWDTENGRPLHSLPSEGGWGTRFASFSPDDSLVAVTDFGKGRIYVWDTQSGERINTLSGHQLQTGVLAWHPDGQFLLSVSSDKTAKIWPTRDSLLQESLARHKGSVSDLSRQEASATLASIARDHTVILSDENTGSEQRRVSLFSTNILRAVDLPPHGATMAATLDGAVPMILDTETGAIRHQLPGHRGAVSSVAYSPDGTRIATGSYDGMLRLWNAETGELLSSMGDLSTPVVRLAWHPNGSQIATTFMDQVLIWDTDGATIAHTLATESTEQAVMFLADGNQILTPGPNNTLRIWNTQTGQLLGTRHQSDRMFYAVAATADEARIVTTEWGGRLHVVHGASGALLAGLAPGIGPIADILSPADGTALYAASADGGVYKMHAVDWRSAPSRSDAVHAAVESAEQAFRQSQRERLLRARSDEPVPWDIYTPAPEMATHLPRLIRSHGDAETPIAGPNLRAAAMPLCLLEGDRIVTVNGLSLDSPENRETAATAAAEAAANQTSLEAVILRDRTTYHVSFRPIAPIELVETVQITREDLEQLFAGLEDILANEGENLRILSSDIAAARGLRLRGNQLYGHVLQLPINSTQWDNYRRIGLVPNNRITEINGTAIENLTQYAALLSDLQAQFDSGTLNQLELRMEVSTLQTIRIRAEVL